MKQQQPDGFIKVVNLQLTCMTFVDPATGWFEIAQVPLFSMDEVKANNVEYIDKTSARISQIFNQVWLSRYPRPVRVIFDNGSEFKKDFVPLLRDFDIKHVCTTIKNPQANAPVERIHQVVRNMLLTRDLNNQVFDYIDPWGENLSSIAWAIRASFHSTLNATPAQLVFGRDIIFNIASIVDWRNITARKQKQIERDNVRENSRRIDFNYQVGQQVFVKNTDIARKLDNPKYGPYEITDVFTNGTVRIQKGSVNERINIRRIEPFFEK